MSRVSLSRCRKSEDVFDEDMVCRMCQVGEAIYASQGGDKYNKVLRKISNIIYAIIHWLTQISFYDGDNWNSGIPKKPRPWHVLAMRLWYSYRLVRVIILMILQYTHDIYLIKLRNSGAVDPLLVPWEVDAIASKRVNDGSVEAQLLMSFANARRRLEFVGTPWKDYTLINGIFLFNQLWNSLMMYVLPTVWNLYIYPAENYIYKMLHDSKRERKRYTKVTVAIMNLLAESSRVGDSFDIANHYDKRISISYEQNFQTVGRLRRLALTGQLEPKNRRASHMKYVLYWQVVYAIVLFVYLDSFIPMFLILAVMPPFEMRPDWKIYYSFADCTELVETICTGALIFILGTCNVSVIMSVILDYTSLLRTLTRETNKSIHEARMSLQKLPRHRFNYLEFNDKLTLMVVQHKMAVSYLDRYKHTINMVGLTLIQALFMTPLVAIVHTPFFDQQTPRGFLYLMFSVLMFADFFLWPVSQVHANACRLYVANTRLTALVTRIEQLPNGWFMCDQTMSKALRNQLSDSKLFERQLSPRVFGIQIDYKFIINLHLKGGFVMLFALVMSHRIISEPSTQMSFLKRVSFLL